MTGQEARGKMPPTKFAAWPYEADWEEIRRWNTRDMKDFEILELLGQGSTG